jgi:indolepyruvate ferredoxin oxidoreductase alpha subunit
MLELRIRACHLHGQFTAKDNKRPSFTLQDAMNNPARDTSRIVLPPASFAHEHEKIERRWPAAVKYIQDHKLNEHFGPRKGDIGIIVQGGMYNMMIRALELLGLSDCFGNSDIPVYVLNVTYPLIPEEVVNFAASKKAVLLIEEGQPDYIEQAINSILRKADVQARLIGKEVLPVAGEYTGSALLKGVKAFIEKAAPNLLAPEPAPVSQVAPVDTGALAKNIPQRPAGFCTGCPERPIFTAMKMVERDMGKFHVSCDIGCHLFSILPPFNIGNTTMGYGLGWAGSSAFNVKAEKRTISLMGDGGFWHNGLTSGVGNAVFNKNDNLLVIVDNNYSAATGGQDILSSRAVNPTRSTKHPISEAVKGIGVNWLKRVRTYDLNAMIGSIKDALTTSEVGPKVIIAESECMLNRQRRVKPLTQKAIKDGKRVVRERYYVDSDTCTGDHACIRLSGCPSLTIKANPNPLKLDPVAYVDNSCVGCGHCGEVAHAAVLCPSFSRVEVIFNPGRLDRFAGSLRLRLINWLQNRAERRRARAAA